MPSGTELRSVDRTATSTEQQRRPNSNIDRTATSTEQQHRPNSNIDRTATLSAEGATTPAEASFRGPGGSAPGLDPAMVAHPNGRLDISRWQPDA
jgi:hypothetical protein